MQIQPADIKNASRKRKASLVAAMVQLINSAERCLFLNSCL